jgi:hypothetical protein
MKIDARIWIVAILALLGLFSSGDSAFSGDYSVDFGAETDAGNDAGSLTCRLGKTCTGELESLGLNVSLYLTRSRNARTVASVHLYGRDPNCCYFEYASEKVTIDPSEPLSRVPFYKGTRARRGLYIENERVGTLYLKFQSRLNCKTTLDNWSIRIANHRTKTSATAKFESHFDN